MLIHRRFGIGIRLWLCWICVCCTFASSMGSGGEFEFHSKEDCVDVLWNGKVVAEYCFADENVSHPYWRKLLTLSGELLTRNHPPVAGIDADDHVGIHTGAWLSFGDVSGHDFWRLKAKVEQTNLKILPSKATGQAEFEVTNQWRSAGGRSLVLQEKTVFKFRAVGNGYLIDWDTELTSMDADVVFGEQEEMGLGIRMAASIAVDKNLGGRLLDSEGRRNGKAIWGKSADWCDYAGIIHGKWCGITVLVDADAGRACRCHARDYGFLALNPFSTKVFTGGEATPFRLAKGESVRLRFGLYIHESPEEASFSVVPAKSSFELVTP